MDASALINIHREGLILAPTIQSLVEAKRFAASYGHRVELIAVLDTVDDLTKSVTNQFKDHFSSIYEVTNGDLGASRQFGIDHIKSEYVFFHDGDDLFSSNWYHLALEAIASDGSSRRAVYHTKMFIGFGDQRYFRELVSSETPLFDPLYLTSEWYFSNKCVAPTSLFKEFPIPANDIKTGIGNEDWTWSSTTLAAGVPHRVVPYTACFYRHKPARLCLGLTPGMIHGPSPLYMPAHLKSSWSKRQTTQVGIAPVNPSTTRVARDYPAESYPHPWIWNEIQSQSRFEPELTDLFSLTLSQTKIRTPNYHMNVAAAYREMCNGLDESSKFFIFITDKNTQGFDFFLEKVICEAREQVSHDIQIIAIFDEINQFVDKTYFLDRYNVIMISVTRLLRNYQLEEWYFHRFMTRVLIQFGSIGLIDFCSDIFSSMLRKFDRAILSRHKNVKFVYPNDVADFGSDAMFNLKFSVKAFYNVNMTFPPVFFLGQVPVELENLWGAKRLSSCECNWALFLQERFHHNASVRAANFQSRFFSLIFEDNQSISEHDLPQHQFSSLPALSQTTNGLGNVFGMLQPGNGWVSEDLLPKAEGLLRENAELDAVLPQVVAYQRAGGGYAARWLDYSNYRQQIASLLDVCLIEMINVPLFVIYRVSSQLGTILGQLNEFEARESFTVINLLLTYTRRSGLLPLERSLCTTSRAHPLNPTTILQLFDLPRGLV